MITDFGSSNREEIGDLAIDHLGRIVVAGKAAVDFGGVQFALARYLDNGALDASFDFDGKKLVDFPDSSWEAALAVTIDPWGRIVAAGGIGYGPSL